ncbi:MAG: APC family permease [Eubacteriales bacterium]|nr:APC family permease [Clostridiales bacterium]MDD6839530.1 APC family permease [Clostridiales bacterium]MDY3822932.1 APC family permease [Eubacteriales bacterium]MDY4469736.1 APC family permease [Eubacteriales bacterium]MDY5801676.1 APC family permease [Eubacteriales bacterium]
MDKLQKRYGLLTAICMVVGIVIGSGVFFKAQTILQKTGGNMPLGILAWIIGGVIMLTCLLAFSVMAQKFEKVNGIVDYAEACVGSKYAYYVGWFLTIIYYPCLTSVLSWLSARYTLVFITSIAPDFPLLGLGAAAGAETVLGPECMALAMFYMCCAYAVNALSPKLAGKLQVSTTIIKLIPLFLMAVVGIIVGLANGTLANNFNTLADVGTTSTNPLFASVCATAFAYEGWIIATSINAELKDAKKNLPRALVIGAIIIIATYIFYYVGVAGGATNQELIDSGATVAFINVFGNVLGNILNLFIAISCIGTMNGLMLGCVRGLYSIAVRGRGPAPHVFSQIDKETNMPHNSAIVGLLLCGFWGLYFFLANLAGTWSGPFVFDSSELPIITIYMLYLPIFIMWIKKATDENAMRRYVTPILAICGSLFMIYASIMGHGIACFWYLIVFAAVMAVGFAFSKEKPIN